MKIFPYTGPIGLRYSRYLQFRFLKWPLIICLISRSAMISYHHFQSESPRCFPLHHRKFEDFPASFDHRGWHIIKYHVNIHEPWLTDYWPIISPRWTHCRKSHYISRVAPTPPLQPLEIMVARFSWIKFRTVASFHHDFMAKAYGLWLVYSKLHPNSWNVDSPCLL